MKNGYILWLTLFVVFAVFITLVFRPPSNGVVIGKELIPEHVVGGKHPYIKSDTWIVYFRNNKSRFSVVDRGKCEVSKWMFDKIETGQYFESGYKLILDI